MNLKNISKLVILVLASNLPLIGSAQCNSFVKSKCIPNMKPYINSGQTNASTLIAGDHTEISRTFYSGQNYRIMVCSQASLGDVKFNLKDAGNNIIFSNKGYGNLWDFKCETTQELTIEVITASSSDAGLDKSGCVSILIGFKQ